MILNVKNLDIQLKNRVVLKNISLDIQAGETIAILGPNGAGKTTLLKAFVGMLKPQNGTIEQSPSCEIAYLPQDGIAPSNLTVLEAVLLGRYNKFGLTIKDKDIEDAHQALDQFKIATLAQKETFALSGGQRQLVGLAQTTFRNPDLFLLDEPTSALDLHRQMLVLDHLKYVVKKQNVAVVSVLHDLSLAARFADRVILLKEGEIIANGPFDTVMNKQSLACAYNVDVEILQTTTGQTHIAPLKPLFTKMEESQW